MVAIGDNDATFHETFEQRMEAKLTGAFIIGVSDKKDGLSPSPWLLPHRKAGQRP